MSILYCLWHLFFIYIDWLAICSCCISSCSFCTCSTTSEHLHHKSILSTCACRPPSYPVSYSSLSTFKVHWRMKSLNICKQRSLRNFSLLPLMPLNNLMVLVSYISHNFVIMKTSLKHCGCLLPSFCSQPLLWMLLGLAQVSAFVIGSMVCIFGIFIIMQTGMARILGSLLCLNLLTVKVCPFNDHLTIPSPVFTS